MVDISKLIELTGRYVLNENILNKHLKYKMLDYHDCFQDG